MRVSENMKTSTLFHDLNRTVVRMLNTQDQITTGRRIHRPSDDPGGTAQVMRLSALRSRFTRYEKNVEDAKHWLTTTESALDEVKNIITESNAVLLQASNDTLGEAERKILSVRMQDMLNRAVMQANQKFGYRYIFGGTNSDTPPFDLNSNVEEESVTSVFDTVVNLNHVDLVSGSIEMSRDYVEDDDFTVDENTGAITVLDPGSTSGTMKDATDYLISYNVTESEDFTPVLDSAVALSNVDLSLGTVSVTSTDGATTFTEGTDYTLDKSGDTITVLSSGGMTQDPQYRVTVVNEVQNESFTADYVTPYTVLELNGGSIVEDSVQITKTFAEGSDYTFDAENGTVTVLGTGNMLDGVEYTANYESNKAVNYVLNPDGVAGVINRRIDEGVKMQVNVSASDVFTGASGILDTIRQAIAALERNDRDAIATARSQLLENENTVTQILGDIGSKLGRLGMQLEKLGIDQVNMDRLISSIEDADVAAAAVQMQRDQIAYEAALRTGSNLIQVSLLNFLS